MAMAAGGTTRPTQGELEVSERRALRAFLEATRRMIDVRHSIDAPIIATFLAVCVYGYHNRKEDPVTITEIANRVGLTKTTVSRHLRYLGYGIRDGEEGLGLVDTAVYPLNRVQKIVYLTPAGRSLASQLAFIMRSAIPEERETS